MNYLYKWVKSVSVVLGILVPVQMYADQEIVITASVDNLLYCTSTDDSTCSTAYPASYNGVGVNRDASMNEFWTFESLIYFDVTAITGKTIKSAYLLLYPEILAGDPWDAYNHTYYAMYVVADLWDPSTVSEYSQPDHYTGYSVPFNVPTSTAGVELDVTYVVEQWADGFDNYGFYLKDEGGLHDYSYNYATMFGSIERSGSKPPKLIVTIEGGDSPVGNNSAIVASIITPLLLSE